MALNDCGDGGSAISTDASYTVPGMTLTGVSLSQSGLLVPALKAIWTAIASAYILYVDIAYVPQDASAPVVFQRALKEDLGRVMTNGIIAGKDLYVQYRAAGLNSVGNWSSVVSVSMPASLVGSNVHLGGSDGFQLVSGSPYLNDNLARTESLLPNSITQSISAFTQGAVSMTANTETAIQNTRIITAGGRVDILADTTLTGSSGASSSIMKLYRSPHGAGTWTQIGEKPGPTPYASNISLTTTTGYLPTPQLDSDVVTGVTVGSTSVSVTGASISGSASVTGSGTIGGSISLSGNTDTAFPAGDTSHNHGLSFGASVNTGSASCLPGSMAVSGSSLTLTAGSVSIPTISVTTGRPTISYGGFPTALVSGISTTYTISGGVVLAMVDNPAAGDWDYQLRATIFGSLTNSATYRFLNTTEVKR